MKESYIFSLKSFNIYYISVFITVFLLIVFLNFIFLCFFYAASQLAGARIPVKVFELLLMMLFANAAFAMTGKVIKKILKDRKDIFRPKKLVLEDSYFLYQDEKGREHTGYWPDVKQVSVMMMKMGYRAKVVLKNFDFVFYSYEFEEIPDNYKAMTKASFSAETFMHILTVFRQRANNSAWKKDFFLRFRKLPFEK